MAQTNVSRNASQMGLARTVLAMAAFAVGFWVLDAGNQARISDTGLLAALLPRGDDLAYRLLVAAAFAAIGATVCVAMRRGERRQLVAMQQTRDAVRRYGALLGASFDQLLTVGRHGEIVEGTESAAALLGGRAEDLRGRPVDDFISLPPGTEAASGTAFSQVLETDSLRSRETVAVHGIAVGGRRFPAEVRITPMPADAGCCYVVAIRDTTDRAVKQKSRSHSESQYRCLFDNLLDGVYRSRPDGTLLAANPALVQMLGYDSASDLMSTANTNEIYSDPQQRTRIVAKLDTDGFARNVEIRLRRRDGTLLPVLANVRAIRDQSGVGIIYEGTLSDISDLLQTRESLEDCIERLRAVTDTARDLIIVVDEQGIIVFCSPSAGDAFDADPQTLEGMDVYRRVHDDDRNRLHGLIERAFVRPGISHWISCRARTASGMRHLEGNCSAYLARDGKLHAIMHCRDVGPAGEAAVKDNKTVTEQ